MLNSLDLVGNPGSNRIVVAMSGGVDSSVVAGLLAQEGYDVVGMTLQLYDIGNSRHRKGACCAGQDIHDAKRVADHLGIPHYVLNYEKRFQETVIAPFAESYLAGETPVPCINCNQTVKFEDLLKTAQQLDAAALATGHYIRSSLLDPKTGRRGMFRPADQNRDQSYFLFSTRQEQLDYLRFPLGDLPKSRTRELARELGLDIADKPDSQDICFVPNGKYADIIARLNPDAAQPGDIVDLKGKVIGRHEGIIHYTIGQRRGLGIALGEPVYVVHIDRANHRVVVGPSSALNTHTILLRQVNWLGDQTLDQASRSDLELWVKVRSTRPPVRARLCRHEGAIAIELPDGEAGVAKGQACVFYESDQPGARIFGGGFISDTIPNEETANAIYALTGTSNRTQANL